MFLGHARHEAGHIHQGDQRDIKGVTEADELRPLIGGVDIKHTGHDVGLVSDHTNGTTHDTPEAHHNIAGKTSLDFEEIPTVHNAGDDFPHIVALLALNGNNVTQFVIGFHHRIGIHHRRLLRVVLRQEAQQFLGDQDCLFVIIGNEVNVAGLGHVGIGTAKLFGGDFFTGDRLNHAGAGNKHIGLPGLDNEVGEGRRIGGAPGTGASNDGNLGNQTR